MNLTRFVPHFHSFKFAPFAIIALFLFTNLTGLVFNRAYSPAVQAAESAQTSTLIAEPDYIPADVPTSGDRASLSSAFALWARGGGLRASW